MLGNSALDAILAKTYKSRLGTLFCRISPINQFMSNATDQRIRHVAIVLQSLDAATSRGLLGQLPLAQSKLVRQAMVRLGTVTPQEREAAFRSMQGLLSASGIRTERQTSKESRSPAAALLASQPSALNDQIELSTEARHQEQQEQNWQVGVPDSSGAPSAASWQHMPAEALADALQGERPIVIATVINQVSVERATAIAQALPMQVASATLAALPHLHLTDPAILRDIQLELERKIGQYQAPKKTNAEGISKLQAIVASMPASQQNGWTNAIAQSNPVLAAKLGWNADLRSPSPASKSSSPVTSREGPKPTETAPQAARSDQTNTEDIFDESMILPFHSLVIAPTETAVRRAADKSLPYDGLPSPSKGTTDKDVRRTEGKFNSAARLNESKQTIAPKHSEAERGKTAIENLLHFSDRDFVAILHACEPQTVLMALSGATKAFVSRVERLMPSKDVKRLRTRLTNLGPIQLRDVDAAQRRIAETAMKMLASGRVDATGSVSFLAAA